MRLVLLATAAALLGGSAYAQTLLGQSEPGGPQALLPAPAHPAAAPAPTTPPEMVQKPSLPPKVTAAPITQTPLPPPETLQKPSPAVPVPPPNLTPAPTAAVPSPPAAPAPQPTASPSVPVVPDVAAGSGTAVSPSVTTPPAAAPGAPTPPPSDVPPPPETAWVPATSAEIAVLNKVEGSTQTMTIPVGAQAQAGDLTISVQACVLRPAGALPNAAVYLSLRSTAQPDLSPAYQGWVVRSMPGATDAENADEAVRLVGCS